jgi:hypothetical protein
MDVFLNVVFWALSVGLSIVIVLFGGIALAALFHDDEEVGIFERIGMVVGSFIPLALMFFLAPWFFPGDQWAYERHNLVTPESLFPLREYSIVEQPHDCDFLTAPLGSKHCHYEPVIYLESGAPHAPLSGLDWATLEELVLGPESRRIVSWNRVED